MDKQIEKILAETAADSLEKLAFVFVYPAEGTATQLPDSVVTASVSFSGSFSGILVMKVSAEILSELAANMLGLDEDEETTLDQQHDVLQETLNVICGNFLPAVAGRQEVFNIDSPQIVAVQQPMAMNHDSSTAYHVKLALEDEQCELLLLLDSPIPNNTAVTGS